MKPANFTPVNRTAALVVSRGEHFEPEVDTSKMVYSDTPLPIKRPTNAAKSNPAYKDLTGLRNGRLTVMGLYAGGKGRWVVRCACGKYEVRTAKAVKNIANNDMCSFCHAVERIKHIYQLEKAK